MRPYLMLVLSHALGDFVLPARRDHETRKDHAAEPWWRDSLHYSLRHLITTLVIMHIFGFRNAIGMAVISAVAHFLVYKGALALSRLKWMRRAALVPSIAEQVVYLYILAWVAGTWAGNTDPAILGFWLKARPPLPLQLSTKLDAPAFTDRALAAVVVYIYVACAGSLIVRNILDSTGFDKQSDVGNPNSGRYIGMLERIIILTFMMCNSLGAAAFVLTAKSIARYPQLSDGRSDYNQRFAEYYLVGTLSSALVALAGGLALQLIWQLLGTI